MNLSNRFSLLETIKWAGSFCWKCCLHGEVDFSLWKTECCAVKPRVTCETSPLGEGHTREVFTLTPAWSQGNWAAGIRWDDFHALPHPQALSVEKWWKLNPYQKKSDIVNIPSHSPHWQRRAPQQNTKRTLCPLLHKHSDLCALHHKRNWRAEDLYSPLPYLFKFHP